MSDGEQNPDDALPTSGFQKKKLSADVFKRLTTARRPPKQPKEQEPKPPMPPAKLQEMLDKLYTSQLKKIKKKNEEYDEEIAAGLKQLKTVNHPRTLNKKDAGRVEYLAIMPVNRKKATLEVLTKKYTPDFLKPKEPAKTPEGDVIGPLTRKERDEIIQRLQTPYLTPANLARMEKKAYPRNEPVVMKPGRLHEFIARNTSPKRMKSNLHLYDFPYKNKSQSSLAVSAQSARSPRNRTFSSVEHNSSVPRKEPPRPASAPAGVPKKALANSDGPLPPSAFTVPPVPAFAPHQTPIPPVTAPTLSRELAREREPGSAEHSKSVPELVDSSSGLTSESISADPLSSGNDHLAEFPAEQSLPSMGVGDPDPDNTNATVISAPESLAEETTAPEPAPEEPSAPEPAPEESSAPEPAPEEPSAPETSPELAPGPAAEPAPETPAEPPTFSEPFPDQPSAPEPASEAAPVPAPQPLEEPSAPEPLPEPSAPEPLPEPEAPEATESAPQPAEEPSAPEPEAASEPAEATPLDGQSAEALAESETAPEVLDRGAESATPEEPSTSEPALEQSDAVQSPELPNTNIPPLPSSPDNATDIPNDVADEV